MIAHLDEALHMPQLKGPFAMRLLASRKGIDVEGGPESQPDPHRAADCSFVER